MEKLKISLDGHSFIKENGERFIWLGDTAWTMPQRMKWDDVDYFMKKRKQQGFTVLQIVALDPERDVEMKNPAGEKALLDNDLSNPREAYFAYLDFIIEKAESYGFYILLLPVWGQLVVGDNWLNEHFEKVVTEENAYQYGTWIGKRYRDRVNVLWCLGGDRMPIHRGTDYRNIWRKMAEGLAKGVLDKDLSYNKDRDSWKDLLITYHACYESETGKCSTMSQWTDEEAWIQFIMIQSGHGDTAKNYKLIEKEYWRKKTMPVWDGEPAYEWMPTTWPMVKEYHGSWMVRKRAYWSIFAGAFGHTYGHCSVWCMISERERDVFTKHSWYEALESEGSGQMKYLRDFLEAIDLSGSVPCQNILLTQSEAAEYDFNKHRQACYSSQKKQLCVYFPVGGSENIDLSIFEESTIFYSWFNPRTGQCSQQETLKLKRTSMEFITPTCKKEEDWVLIAAASPEQIAVTAQSYGELPEQEKAKKVFDW